MQQTLQISKFEPSHKKYFDAAYGSLEFPLAEHSFAWLSVWSHLYKDVEWAKINGNMCLFVTFENNRHVWGPPIGGSKLRQTLETCFQLCSQYNSEHGIEAEPAAMYIPEELANSYSALEGFELKHQNQDYIYETGKLIRLPGGQFKDKRNLINYFLANHRVSTEDYAERHEAECLQLLDKWHLIKSEEMPDDCVEKFEAEAEAARRTIKLAAELGLKGRVFFVDGKLEAFAFGEPVNRKMCSIMVEKANLRIRGLSQYVFQDFVKAHWSGYELVNAGEDWGVEYLRRAKLSYHPAIIHKSYMLVRKKVGK